MTSPLTGWPRLDVARLIGLTLESFFNGVFWTLFYRCNMVLYRRSKARSEGLIKPINLTGWALFSCIVAHLILEIYAASVAFITPVGQPCVAAPLTPAELFYLVLDHPANVAYSAIYVITTIIADSFLTYRLYVVWNDNRYIIIPPIFFCIGLLVTGTMVTYLFHNARQPIFGIARRWILACYILTFLCNFYSTSLLAFKLSMAEKNAQSIGVTSVFHKIVEVMIQSAAIYCILVIFSLAFMAVSSNMSFITVAITIPTIGIIFCMIVTRTHDQFAVQRASQQVQFTTTAFEFGRPQEQQRRTKESQGESLDMDSRSVRPRSLTIGSALSSPTAVA